MLERKYDSVCVLFRATPLLFILFLRIAHRKSLLLLFRYYSMYGHVAKLAEEIKKGASSVEGVEVKLWQVKMLVMLRLVMILGGISALSTAALC